MSTSIYGRDYISFKPLGGGADDGVNLNAALLAGLPIVFKKGSTYTLNTKLTLISNSILHLNGANINTAIPTEGGITGAPFYATPLNPGANNALNSKADIGSLTLSVTTKTNLVVGGFARLIHTAGGGNWIQLFKVTGISGAGPYTITLDREVSQAIASADAVLQYCEPVQNVRIYGQGATITATATVDRGMELSCMWNCLVEDLNFVGPFGWGASYDVGTYNSIMRHIKVEGGAGVTGTGVASEANEACLFEDIYCTGVLNSSGGQAGFFSYSGRNNVYRKIISKNCLSGLMLDNGADTGIYADGVSFDGCAFDSNTTGILNTGTNYKISKTSVCNNSGIGVQINTSGSNVPQNNTFTDCDIKSNGNSGVYLVTGRDTSFNDCRISSNGVEGLKIDSGVKGTRINGGRMDLNTTYTVITADELTMIGVTGYDNGDSLTNNSTTTVRLTGCELGATSGSYNWHGFYNISTGTMIATDCKTVTTGFSGVNIGFLASAGKLILKGCSSVGNAGPDFGVYNNGGLIRTDADCNFSGSTAPCTGVINITQKAAGNYTVLVTDKILQKTAITGGGDTITLPNSLKDGRRIVIIDASGTAGTNNITVTPAAGTINGAASFVMNTNYSSIEVTSDGTNWFLTA